VLYVVFGEKIANIHAGARHLKYEFLDLTLTCERRGTLLKG